MKQSLARVVIIFSLILSIISLILSLISFYLPNWKYVQFRLSESSRKKLENDQMDPLIRNEIDKYSEILYRQDQTHSFGLLTHCIIGEDCGQNNLLSFEENNYGACHNIRYHHQCIFLNSLLILPTKCSCRTPSYTYIIHKLFILILILQIIFIFINCLRLLRQRYCSTSGLNDIQLRLIAIISTLFSSIFLITILVQQNFNRFTEPLEFFESMHRYYLHKQIYTLSNDLEIIRKEIAHSLSINFGASYIFTVFILISTIILFFASSTIEIKSKSNSNGDNENENDESENDSIKQRDNNIVATQIIVDNNDQFIPFQQIRFARQTKV